MKHVFPIRSVADLPEAIRAARFAMAQAGFRINDKSELSFVAEKGNPYSAPLLGGQFGQGLWVLYVEGCATSDGTAQVELARNFFDFESRRNLSETASLVRAALQSARLLAPVAPARRDRGSKS
jgi:hypothetical protein